MPEAKLLDSKALDAELNRLMDRSRRASRSRTGGRGTSDEGTPRLPGRRPDAAGGLFVPGGCADAEAAPEAPVEAAPRARKVKPKPRPKPQAKPAEKPTEKPAGTAAGAPPEAAAPNPAVPLAPAPSPSMLAAAPPVACEKGEAVRYEASGGVGKASNANAGAVELWVTRSG